MEMRTEKVSDKLKAPFPYMGGKSTVAHTVWSRLGDVDNYVESFFGSGAVLLARPHEPKIETVNDADGLLANFFRAIQATPDEVAHYADGPVNENDLHARHIWLVNRKESMQARLEGDPEWYDAKAAGWWVWGACCWIGSGWCAGKGPWKIVDGELVKAGDGNGVNRKRVHLGDRGKGIHRQLVHLGNQGMGIHRQLIHNGEGGIYEWFRALSERLRRVRVCCGDWSRVMGPSVTLIHGLTGIFLDPPYSDTAGRDPDLYATDSLQVAHDVRKWCLENGDNPMLRIALCGYESEHEMPDTWECVAWKAHGGYSNSNLDRDNQNKHRERIWFSPNCLKAGQTTLF